VACGSLANGQLVTVWEDDRSGLGVFAQNVFDDGTLSTETTIGEPSGITPDVRLLTNPTDHPILVFGPRSSGTRTITLLDIRGSVVLTRRSGVSEGVLVPFRTEELAPGLYAIRVDGPTGIRTLRWVKE
jgi:hypothetical protein